MFWKALAVQTAAVMALFLMLVALPLPKGFFEDAGFATGPLAWILCSFATARILSLPTATAVIAASLGGLAGVVAFLAINHTAGLVGGLLAFAASCGAKPSFDRGDGIRTRDPRRERPVS
jgi:hypothetical protein